MSLEIEQMLQGTRTAKEMGTTQRETLPKKKEETKKKEKRKRDSFRNSEIEKADPKRWKETPLLTRVKKRRSLELSKNFFIHLSPTLSKSGIARSPGLMES